MILVIFSLELILFGLILSWLGILFLVVPIVVGIIAMIEKVNYHKLNPLTPEQERKFIDNKKKLISDAISSEFSLCGYFTDGDKGILESYIGVSISCDYRTILWIQYGGGAKYKFISELDNGQWVVTSEITGLLDLSGWDL